jgi:hypothetical protein
MVACAGLSPRQRSTSSIERAETVDVRATEDPQSVLEGVGARHLGRELLDVPGVNQNPPAPFEACLSGGPPFGMRCRGRGDNVFNGLAANGDRDAVDWLRRGTTASHHMRAVAL